MTPSALNSMSRRAISVSSQNGPTSHGQVGRAIRATVTPGSWASRLMPEQQRRHPAAAFGGLQLASHPVAVEQVLARRARYPVQGLFEVDGGAFLRVAGQAQIVDHRIHDPQTPAVLGAFRQV